MKESERKRTSPPASRRGAELVMAALAILVLAFLAGLLPRLSKRRELAAAASERQRVAPLVEVVTPHEITTDRALDLPGTVQPLEETVIYPRAAGYVRRWLVDIGDEVKEGRLLAEIDTPELDAQIDQARADLAQAEAARLRAGTNAQLSAKEAARYENLAPAGVASQQELEQRRAQAQVDQAGIQVAAALVASQQASLHRLLQLKGFARVVAPFAGTITARTIERGALVSAGGATPLFRLAATDPVRVFVNVPQDVAPGIRTSVAAQISVREYGHRLFPGVVARAAGSLDEATRTMRTEVRVPNPKHELLPGMFVRVALTLPLPHRLLEVPATALFNDAQGTRVAVVDAQGRVAMRPVAIDRDTGQTIQIATGLTSGDRVVRIANPALTEGMAVQIVQ